MHGECDMAFEYVNVEEAISKGGLRMVVVGGLPSVWSEAAKGILHIKQIPWVAVRLSYDEPALVKWAGELSGPIAVYEDEAPRSGWADILLLAERLAPTPSLLPDDPEERALVFGLSHELCGEGGLAWSRRLQAVHAGLRGDGGFAKPVAGYLAKKYGYTPEAGEAAGARVRQLLTMFTARLERQRDAGSDFLVGQTRTAADVYAAASVAMFAPLPEEVCAMRQSTRATFNWLDDLTRSALSPTLVAHRDRMYRDHLELPLSL